MAFAGQTAELGNALVRIVGAGKLLQIVADELVEALAQGLRSPAGAMHQLLVDGQGKVHSHIIRGHVLCVNFRPQVHTKA